MTIVSETDATSPYDSPEPHTRCPDCGAGVWDPENPCLACEECRHGDCELEDAYHLETCPNRAT